MRTKEYKPRPEHQSQCPDAGWRRIAYVIIFESDTPLGKLFDVVLLIVILTSIIVVSLETVPRYATSETAMNVFWKLEWIFTALFTLEYAVRIICLKKPMQYVFSFSGLIDACAFLPSYLAFFGGPRMRTFAMVRSIRLLWVFRVVKLLRMMSKAIRSVHCSHRAFERTTVELTTSLDGKLFTALYATHG